jgi:ABC-2 type transport system permease protein
MRAFLHHLAYDFKTGIRDKAKLLMYYLLPLVFFAFAGGLMTAVNPLFKGLMLPAMILFAVMSSSLLFLPSSLITARETGVFRSYRINGVPAGSILGVPVVSTAFHMTVVAVIIAIAGTGLFGGVAPTHLPGFILAGLLSYLAFAGIGTLIGVAAANDTASMLIAQCIYIPSILLGGLMMPASVLPSGFRRVALLLPASHAMRIFAGLGFPQDSASIPWMPIAILAASAVLSFGLAALLFQWDSRARQPSKKAFAAFIAVLPFAAAVVLG